MNNVGMVGIGITLVGLASLVAAEAAGSHLGKWLTKPVASLGFVLACAGSGNTADDMMTALMAGLVLCLIGDVLLIEKRSFLAGLVAFLLGHVGFAVLFLIRDVSWLAVFAALVPIGVFAVFIARWLHPHVADAMWRPVLVYMIVISVMVALAFGTHVHDPNPLIMWGAIGFFFSDLAVARNRFVAPGFVNRAWGLPLYYLSVLALACFWVLE